MNCNHEIAGEDYGECRRCEALFFRTSGGLWQSYDDGRRYVPEKRSRRSFGVAGRLKHSNRPKH
jgi:hypothetical protein